MDVCVACCKWEQKAGHSKYRETSVNEVQSKREYEKKSRWGRYFSCRLDRSEAHPASRTKGTRCFSGVKRPKLGADHPYVFNVALQMGWSCSLLSFPLPLYACVGISRVTFTFEEYVSRRVLKTFYRGLYREVLARGSNLTDARHLCHMALKILISRLRITVWCFNVGKRWSLPVTSHENSGGGDRILYFHPYFDFRQN